MKLQGQIEQFLLKAAPCGLTHRELAQMTGHPEPSVRRALQVIRAGRPRFKAGEGMFDVVEHDLLVNGRKKFVVKWRTKSYDADKVVVTITAEDGTKRELTSAWEHARIEFPDRGADKGERMAHEPDDFDGGVSSFVGGGE